MRTTTQWIYLLSFLAAGSILSQALFIGGRRDEGSPHLLTVPVTIRPSRNISLCVDAVGRGSSDGFVVLKECSGGVSQTWVYKEDGFRLAKEEKCMEHKIYVGVVKAVDIKPKNSSISVLPLHRTMWPKDVSGNGTIFTFATRKATNLMLHAAWYNHTNPDNILGTVRIAKANETAQKDPKVGEDFSWLLMETDK